MANQNPLTLTRQQLYDLVWSKPVRDVALAKRCRAVRVPIPPRGYWARVAAGQKPRRPTLLKYRGSRTKVSDRVASDDRHEARSRVRASKDGLAACPTEQTDQSPGGNRTDDEPTVTFTPRPTPAPTEPTTPISPAEAALRTRRYCAPQCD